MGLRDSRAAHAALDGLAHHRRGLSLPATVINWGHLGEVADLAERGELGARLERQGVLCFTVRQATECLAAALLSREPQVSVLRMDWTRWRGLGITDHVSTKFAHLLRDGDGAQGPAEVSPETIRSASAAERPGLVEAVVRGKVAGLLGIPAAELDADRPLLALGLDSLMAVELRNWVENQLGIGLPISSLMRSGGVAALTASICAALDTTRSTAADGPTDTEAGATASKRTAAEEAFPMSAGQRALWYAYRRDPAGSSYNVFLPTRVRSPLDVEALKATMELVVARHSALRTTFSDASGRLLQRVHAALPPEFILTDASGSDVESVRAAMLADAERPFDLERGPLVRMSVARLAADDWVVLATTHHIVVDFWSLILILDEVGRIYPSLAAGGEPDLPPAADNYAEFVRRQEALLAGDRGAELERYWTTQLAGLPTVLELPTDRVRPKSFTGRADSVPIAVPADTVAAIGRLAAARGVTPVAVVLAAVQVLVARTSGRSSFVIGAPVPGRGQQRFENTVGFFVNMLPLPARLDDNPSVADLVNRVGGTLVGGLEHEDYPLASIVRDLLPDRDPSRSPLLQVSCTFEKAHLRAEQGRAGFLFPGRSEVTTLGGMRQESFPVPRRTCLYDAEFVLELTDDSLRGMLCFCRDLFAADSMGCMARNFESLLAALVRSAETPIDAIAWSTDGLPARAPSVSIDGPATLDQFHRPVLTEPPARPAIVDGAESWDYGQLADHCGRVGADLGAAGVGPGALVPVVGHGGAALVGTVAAVLAGAVPVPIDSRQPAVDADTLLDDAMPRAVLVADGAGWIDAAGGRAENLRRIAVGPAVASGPSTPLVAAANRPEDLAYCIFTSGSTGRPKGVLVEHRAIANTIAWRHAAVPLTGDDRVLLLFSHQFDAALGIVLSTLSQAATVVLADRGVAADIARLIDQVVRDRITVLPAVPSLLQLVAGHPRFTECVSLRQIWSGGEPLPADLPGLVRRLPGVVLWNFDGPTEAAVEAAAGIVEHDDPTRHVPIGRPVAGTRLLVLDAARRPVPDTVPGELAIAGPGLARGYLARPALTAERFVTLGPEAARLPVYLTGDRCRRRADGRLEFLGRLDDQVKLRGYRLELGEIEACLGMHPAVAGVAAKVIDRDSPRARLVGFVVPARTFASAAEASRAAHATLAADLRGWAADRLAAYKVPSSIVLVDALPLSPSGKIDRSRLPDALAAEATAEGCIPPSTTLERHIATLWQEALGLERVGVNQNFFDLGGTSLQAATLTVKLGEQLGVHVPTALLFDLADIGQIARRLVQLHRKALEPRFGHDAVA
ncbi:MAG: amino acid adenylation domain-containing protein, partial [Planctomycetia bacterium]